jgi:hypothetical protein
VEVKEPTFTGYGCDGSISADGALTERQFRQEKQHENRRQYLHNENIRARTELVSVYRGALKRCATQMRAQCEFFSVGY